MENPLSYRPGRFGDRQTPVAGAPIRASVEWVTLNWGNVAMHSGRGASIVARDADAALADSAAEAQSIRDGCHLDPSSPLGFRANSSPELLS